RQGGQGYPRQVLQRLISLFFAASGAQKRVPDAAFACSGYFPTGSDFFAAPHCMGNHGCAIIYSVLVSQKDGV
ncbi:MAG: hypothetical protein ACI3XZ_10285, partial [Butyricicoccus sp.]